MAEKYFKIQDPKVLKAWKDYLADREALNKAATGFAAHFGAEAIFTESLYDGLAFKGLHFETPADTTDWTKPTREDHSVQKPLKNAAKGLREEYDRLFPNPSKVPFAPVLESVGFSEMDVRFAAGRFYFFVSGGAAYLETTLTPGSEVDAVEIVGSEFEKADASVKS